MLKKAVYAIVGLSAAYYIYLLGFANSPDMNTFLSLFTGWALIIGGLNWGIVALSGKDLLDHTGLD